MSDQDYHPKWSPRDKDDITKRYPPRPRPPPLREGSVKILPEGERPKGPFELGREFQYEG